MRSPARSCFSPRTTPRTSTERSSPSTEVAPSETGGRHPIGIPYQLSVTACCGERCRRVSCNRLNVVVNKPMAIGVISMGSEQPMGMAGEQPMGVPGQMAREMNGFGHLYMQTNEIRNCVIHYLRTADGAITAGERIVTG